MSILKRPEFVEIDGIQIEKRGCLKIRELEEYDDAVKEAESLKDLSALRNNLEAAQRCVTILMKRVDPAWTLERTKAPTWKVMVDGKPHDIEPDAILIDSLFEFFMLELRRGRSLDEMSEVEAEAPKKRSTGSKSS